MNNSILKTMRSVDLVSELLSGVLAGLFTAAMPFILFCGLSAHAAPAEVLIIRHAEKPAQGNHLNDRGQQRAQALVPFFETNPSVLDFGVPVAIYASSPKDSSGSYRAIETVEPLAAGLKISINEDYTKKDYDQMITEIISDKDYNGQSVLISWEHNKIPDIVKAFGWESAPDTWDDDVFDRVWILKFVGNQVISFKNIPQHILPGDDVN